MFTFHGRPRPHLLVSGGCLLLAAACSRAPDAVAGAAGLDAPGVPVDVAEVRPADMNRSLAGIGTVQALNTVTIRPQVDGKIVQLMFQDGQDVHHGDLLAQIDPRPYQSALDEALAKQAQDQVQVEYAEKVVERDTALATMLDQQTRDQHRATMLQLKAGAKADEAAVSNARVQLEYTRITAPIDGRVGFRLVDEGNIVHAGDANGLVVIKQLRPIAVVFALPEKSLETLRTPPGLTPSPSPLAVSAYDRDNTRILGQGFLGAIDNQIDEVSGTFKLKAVFGNEAQTLWPGQFVNVQVLVSQRKALPMVPATALQQGPDGMYVYVVTADSKAAFRAVTVALTENGQSFIESGLAPGERVVVDGQYLLQPNARIQVRSTPAIAPAR